jgi:hypothetical protein
VKNTTLIPGTTNLSQSLAKLGAAVRIEVQRAIELHLHISKIIADSQLCKCQHCG